MSSRYDQIGAGYARTRREDPLIREQIARALGTAESVVNVGAGPGSYEPRDRHVIAIEPSETMAGQRATGLPPAVRATADALPLHDQSVDAAMAILTLHHWDEGQEQGVRELRRVARGPVVILSVDPEVSGRMWLMSEYLVEVGELDRRIFPAPTTVLEWLGGDGTITPVPVRRDTPDWTLVSFWAHPERVLDAQARDAVSGFARMPGAVVERVVGDVARDLRTGLWDERHGHLREIDEYDGGLRLITAMPG